MTRIPTTPRISVSLTIDVQLLAAVDAYVGQLPDLDRSDVLDAALRLWLTRQQDRAMEAQFREPQSEEERAELAAWRRITNEAALRIFGEEAADGDG